MAESRGIITGIKDETPNTKTFRVKLDKPINFLPGQFAMLCLTIEGQLVKRAYSFSSSPANPKDVEFTVKRAPDGKFAPHLFSSRINDAVTVEGPHGIFTYIDNSARDLVLIAGGSGIAPMRAIIRHILEQKQDVRIQLIYANKTLRDIIFKEELDELSSANDNLALHYVLENPPSGWKGGAGFITHDFIKKRVRDFSKPLFYICGPPPMVQKMIETVTRLGATHDRIKLEQFN